MMLRKSSRYIFLFSFLVFLVDHSLSASNIDPSEEKSVPPEENKYDGIPGAANDKLAEILDSIRELKASDAKKTEEIAELKKSDKEKTEKIAELKKSDEDKKEEIAALKKSDKEKTEKIAENKKEIDDTKKLVKRVLVGAIVGGAVGGAGGSIGGHFLVLAKGYTGIKAIAAHVGCGGGGALAGGGIGGGIPYACHKRSKKKQQDK